MSVIHTVQFHDRVKCNGSLQIVSSNSRLVHELPKLFPLISMNTGKFIPRRFLLTVLTVCLSSVLARTSSRG